MIKGLFASCGEWPHDYSVVGCRLKFNFITVLINYSMFHCFDEIKEAMTQIFVDSSVEM